MKYLLILTIFMLGCTDTDRAGLSALGNPGEIKCYSGTLLIFEGKSTGVIQTVENSDGWEFKDAVSGKLIRVTGACVIKN